MVLTFALGLAGSPSAGALRSQSLAARCTPSSTRISPGPSKLTPRPGQPPMRQVVQGGCCFCVSCMSSARTDSPPRWRSEITLRARGSRFLSAKVSGSGPRLSFRVRLPCCFGPFHSASEPKQIMPGPDGVVNCATNCANVFVFGARR
eukprot:1944416-Rhodomonas_salina.2